MNYTKLEQETIICYNQQETKASIYTCDPALIRKLDKLCENNASITVSKQDAHSKTYSCPKKWVKVKSPRQLTDELRQKLAENAKKNLGGAK